MTDDEVEPVLALLTAAFSFPGDTIVLWVEALTELSDFEAAKKTAMAMVRDATDRYTPALGSFLQTYNRWKARHDEERGEMADYDRLAIARSGRSSSIIPTMEEGIAIAWADYCDEVTRQGRQPNRALFDAFLGVGREERRLDPRNQRSRGWR